MPSSTTSGKPYPHHRRSWGRSVGTISWLGAVALLLAALWISFAASYASTEALEKLFGERRYFELKAALDSRAGTAGPEDLFYRGIVANVFNRVEESVGYLTSYLQADEPGQPQTRIREALGALADDYSKLFQYGKAADTRERIAPILEKELSPADYAAFLSVIAFDKALASAPPQTVEIPGDTETRMTEYHEIPASFDGEEVLLLPDTGSALSLIILSDAKRLGLRILDVKVRVGTSTGESVTARPCLVPEVRVGGLRIRNAVFLVVPDKMFYSRELRRQRGGILGFPVLNALKEITFTPKGAFSVSSPPRLTGPSNFFLERHNPVLEAHYSGRRLLILFDTGSFGSELFPSFFRAFQTEIKEHGTFSPEDIEGIGTHTTAPVYLMKGLRFSVAGQDVVFERELPILTKPTNEASDVYDGTFSLDLMDAARTLTINYEAMRIALR